MLNVGSAQPPPKMNCVPSNCVTEAGFALIALVTSCGRAMLTPPMPPAAGIIVLCSSVPNDWALSLVEATTSKGLRRVAGTLFGPHPRLVELFGIDIEAELEGSMLYIVNTDAPGFIGKLGTTLGDDGINIATFNLGRRKARDDAASLVAVDSRRHIRGTWVDGAYEGAG